MARSESVEYIDLTPTWSEILPHWLMLYRQAILGQCDNNDLVRTNAEEEFERMAKAADMWNELCKGLKKGELSAQELIDEITCEEPQS